MRTALKGLDSTEGVPSRLDSCSSKSFLGARWGPGRSIYYCIKVIQYIIHCNFLLIRNASRSEDTKQGYEAANKSGGMKLGSRALRTFLSSNLPPP